MTSSPKNNSSIFGTSLILLILLNSACTTRSELNNKVFLQRYGSDVNRINSARDKAAYDYTNPKMENPKKSASANDWKDPAKSLGIEGAFNLRSAFVDTSKLQLKKPAGEFLPNLETYLQGREMKNMGPDIFDVTYDLENYPKSYRRNVVSFDDITIPTHDYFGIKSNLGSKQYNIIDHQALQQSIDFINESKTPENREFERILLEEKKEIRKAKMAQILIGKTIAKPLVPEDKNLEEKEENTENKNNKKDDKKEITNPESENEIKTENKENTDIPLIDNKVNSDDLPSILPF